MKDDPVTLQLIANALAYASEEMGLALRNAAYSPNIRERMDHSAALFDARGRLLAQAEHVPVHLGSLPWGVTNILAACESNGLTLEEGTMVMCNDPYLTGTHLNDVTVISPIYDRGELVAYSVNKAHHSDVGGRVPGSISSDAGSLFEEGVVLEPRYLKKDGKIVHSTVGALASASRTPVERKGDLLAQVAANVTGTRRVKALVSKYGASTFSTAGRRSIAHSESLTRGRISRFKRGTYKASDFLEGPDGEELKIAVKLKVSKSDVSLDYSGTAAQVGYPLNAVFGVTISGAYFVLRCLLGDDIPANHGAFAPIRVSAPTGSLLNPTRPHPVGGGNVETSQRNADAVFRAFAKADPKGVPAAAGGSMNNVMVGGRWRGLPWAFYETIGVGLGGSRLHDGIDGIQCNMTNTLNTPIEEIERTYPLQMTRYEFRPDSSGPGRSRGGSGLVRSYRALSDGIVFTILADRERHSPWGLAGGRGGARTLVLCLQKGKWKAIRSKSTVELRAGEEVSVFTAGGGGYGSPKSRRPDFLKADVENGFISEEKARRDYGYSGRRA